VLRSSVRGGINDTRVTTTRKAMLNSRRENKASMAMDMPHKRAGVDMGIRRRLMAEARDVVSGQMECNRRRC
jgi:hypothetical protein